MSVRCNRHCKGIAVLCIDRPERKAFQLLFDTEDQKEGMRAFLEKRKPAFRGR
jgi:enoyl-CoA hydratase/carnithine racemase